ncbi:MAG: nitrilase-related carbon-nitrogen hydrolase [Kiritimatiellia bacterium]|nr:nitrilase-related carbon-nitrogen hydrolase [Kiritimatiellia bacterium]
MKRRIVIMLCLWTALGVWAADTVRVAAIQCPSVMGQTEDNLRNIIHLVRKAAAQGAKIVVLPECAVQVKNWFGKQFPVRAVVPHGFDVIAANWTSSTPEQSWPGRGHSCVITREGKVLAMSEAVGNNIVLADLEIRRKGDKPFTKSSLLKAEGGILVWRIRGPAGSVLPD